MWIHYDDDVKMACKAGEENFVIDSDGDALEIQYLKSDNVGSAAYKIWRCSSGETEKEVLPAGVNIRSYTEEIRPMNAAVTKVSQEEGETVRIFTDSLVLVQALQGNIRTQCTILQRLALALHRLREKNTVWVAWVPSHCGIMENERVDQLAKTGLRISLSEQFSVAVDLADVNAQLKQTVKRKNVFNVSSDLFSTD
eukprot:gb/GEZJ01003973.1/.p1 GENE.gb/GEZJ01003973.1/~~gb/GEZJ01003973.1/.p1  ORF type:complete len:197 (-),score=26.70 gb/GEZJ01003973.1/:332-922(-)